MYYVDMYIVAQSGWHAWLLSGHSLPPLPGTERGLLRTRTARFTHLCAQRIQHFGPSVCTWVVSILAVQLPMSGGE